MDLKGANLDKTCLTNADLRGAAVNAATSISTARFCGTIMPDGAVNDRDCERPTRCCEACTAMGDECNDETAPCCDGGQCVAGTCEPGGCQGGCGQDEVCCEGACVDGDCCDSADCPSEGRPICVSNTCFGCTIDNECIAAGKGDRCCLGLCVDGVC